MDIYLDTNLWNELLKQRVDPVRLVSSLKGSGARLVLSDEVIYELARALLTDPGDEQAGIELFSLLREFIALDTPVMKDNMALIAAEMQAVQWLMSEIHPFITAGDYDVVRAMVDRLALGEIPSDVTERIDHRLALRSTDRVGQARFFQQKPEVRLAYSAVSPSAFPTWLAREECTPRATQYLASQIHNYFHEHPISDAMEYARVLQQKAVANRASKALIRRNIYINWRGACRGSVPKDLYPDTTHITSAVYCDAYATKERGQVEYAHLLLTPATRVLLYDSLIPIQEWLLACTSSSVALGQ
jgi:hypothetical protein